MLNIKEVVNDLSINKCNANASHSVAIFWVSPLNIIECTKALFYDSIDADDFISNKICMMKKFGVDNACVFINNEVYDIEPELFMTFTNKLQTCQ